MRSLLHGKAAGSRRLLQPGGSLYLEVVIGNVNPEVLQGLQQFGVKLHL